MKQRRNRNIYKYNWGLQQLATIDRTTGWKINNYIEELNNTMNPQNLIDVYRALLPTTPEYTFCKHPWNIYQDKNLSWAMEQASSNLREM